MREWPAFGHLSAQLLHKTLEEVELRQIQDLWLSGSESDEHLQFRNLFGVYWASHDWTFLEKCEIGKCVFMFCGENCLRSVELSGIRCHVNLITTMLGFRCGWRSNAVFISWLEFGRWLKCFYFFDEFRFRIFFEHVYFFAKIVPTITSLLSFFSFPLFAKASSSLHKDLNRKKFPPRTINAESIVIKVHGTLCQPPPI